MTWLLVGTIVGVSLLVVLAMVRYRHWPTVREWSGLMSPELHKTVEAVEEHTALDRHMAEDAFRQALTAQAGDEFKEAVRLLELAYWVIEDATPSRLERLRAMSHVCRQAAAILPMPPVAAGAFRTPGVRAVAGAGGVLHRLVVSPAERLALRVRVLGSGLRLARWTMRRSRMAAAVRPARGRAWAAFEAALADWKTLDVAHVQTFRAVMMSLAVELRRDEPVAVK